VSLLDSLLLEGYRDPRDIYIALRADGQKGSGTIDDPYDGGTRQAASFQASLTFKRGEFVVQAQNGIKGLSVGATIGISRVHGPAETWFNQSFTVDDVLQTQLVGGTAWPRIFTVIGSGAPPAPPDIQFNWNTLTGRIILTYTDSTTLQQASVAITIDWPVARVDCGQDRGVVSFDAVTISDVSDASFAGTFPILGAHGANHSFRFRLTCSSLPADVSTALSCAVTKQVYRFDEVMRSAPVYSVIHLGPGVFETRGGAPIYVANDPDWTLLYVGYALRAGQRLLGSGLGATTLRLALPVDEINQTAAVTHFSNSLDRNADYAEVADLTVDCNAPGHAAPYGIFPAPVTCGAVGVRGSFLRLHRVRAINYCTQGRAECFGLLCASGWGQAGTFNVIEDCITELPGENNTHETTLIGSVGDPYGSARSAIARHNYVNCAYLKSDGSSVSSAFVAVESITQDPNNSERFVLVTKRPHGRETPNNVRISGVTATDRLNGSFPVVQKDSDTRLVFEVIGGAASGFNASGAYIGVDFHGPHGMSGTGCVTEGNSVFDCAHGLYTDTGSTRDAVVRHNYYSGALRGVNINFSPEPGGLGATTDPRTAASVTRADPPNGRIATFRIPDGTEPLAVSVGEAVTVTGVLLDESLDNPYNGTFLVVTVSSDRREFTYEMKSEPAADADLPPSMDPNNPQSFFFRSRYQVRRFTFEDNLCDLSPFDINSANTDIVPRGMQSIALKGGPPFMFPGAIIRNNVFQHIDNTPAVVAANGSYLFALRLKNFDSTLIEGNLIGISNPHTLHHENSGVINGFNNRTLGGDPLPIFENFGGGGPPFVKDDGLEDRVADALLLSLL
jgi:hypothetical protein